MIKKNLFFIALITTTCNAEEFDSNFLVGNASGHSIENAEAAGFKNGDYLVSVFLNGKYITEKKIKIISSDGILQSCLSEDTLKALGVRSDVILPGECYPMKKWVNGASEYYDENAHSLNLSVPDAMLVKTDRYKVSPYLWDYGETMFYSNYLASMNSSKSSKGHDYNGAFLDLENGFNLGRWQLHNRTTTVSAFGVTKTYLRDLYVEKPLPENQMEIRGGRSFYSGEGLDSFSYEGVRLYTDDSMLDQSMVKYSPVVTGNITSQAKLVVVQQQNIIYEGVFPPGHYKISALQLLNDYDPLSIYVYEAGKPPYHYSMPVHSASGLLKPGRKKWSFTAGKTALNDNYYRSAQFAGLNYAQGISNSLSVNGGGLILSNSYAALTGGGDLYTAVVLFSGKLSLTRQQSSNADTSTGLILNSSYNKIIESIGVTVSSGFTRYSKGGNTGVEASLTRERNNMTAERFFYPVIRNEVDLNVSKSSDLGDLSIQFGAFDYYRRNERNYRYGLNYQYFFTECSLSFSVNRTLNDFGPGEVAYNVSLSVPLSIGKTKYFTDSGLTVSRQAAKLHNGASTAFGSNDKNNVNIYTGRELGGERDSRQELGGSVSFDEPSSNSTLGVTKSADFRQLNANAAGSFVIHKEGITLGKTLGNSFALIDAPGAGGASIDNGSVIVDKNGYALVPSLTPYSENMVNISPGKMKGDIEIQNTSKSVIPVSGSSLRVHYLTVSGVPVLVKILNRSLPVGLTVRDDKGNPAGMTGQSSLIYLRQSSVNKNYSVIWGDGREQRCDFVINLISSGLAQKFIKMDSACVH